MNACWQQIPHAHSAEALPLYRYTPPVATEVWFYAPGYLALASADQAQNFEASLRRGATSGDNLAGGSGELAAVEILRHARAAQQAWVSAVQHPFAPVCLTLYLNNTCNLKCTYCYSEPSVQARPRLTLSAIFAAADLVATNCRAQHCPFTVVLHGGGEPTLDWRLADQVLDGLERRAGQQGLAMFRYVATNGVMSAELAHWLARRFDLVGISCDGPEAVQGRQRPLCGGRNSARYVVRTAAIIRAAGKPLHIRTTVTRYSLERQAEIAEYLCQELQPVRVQVEPAYRVGRAAANESDCLTDDQAELFVAEFFRARDVAERFGVPWLTSGSRPGEIHGPYCQVFRDVLHLVPGGVASACFKATEAYQARTQGVAVGEAESASARFALDLDRISHLRRQLRAEPARCTQCFNRYHCVRDCPDKCPLESNAATPTFRCQVQQSLTQALLERAASQLRATRTNMSSVAGVEVAAQ